MGIYCEEIKGACDTNGQCNGCPAIPSSNIIECETSEKLNTPMLSRMLEIQEDSQLCGEFLDFLLSKFSMFDKKQIRETPYMNVMGAGDYINKEKLLAEFFDIDLEEAEKERRIVLQTVVDYNKK